MGALYYHVHPALTDVDKSGSQCERGKTCKARLEENKWRIWPYSTEGISRERTEVLKVVKARVSQSHCDISLFNIITQVMYPFWIRNASSVCSPWWTLPPGIGRFTSPAQGSPRPISDVCHLVSAQLSLQRGVLEPSLAVPVSVRGKHGENGWLCCNSIAQPALQLATCPMLTWWWLCPT